MYMVIGYKEEDGTAERSIIGEDFYEINVPKYEDFTINPHVFVRKICHFRGQTVHNKKKSLIKNAHVQSDTMVPS